MKKVLFVFLLSFACAAGAQTGDVLGSHDLATGSPNIHGGMSAACLYCHVPHSGNSKGPLWGQTLSNQTYTIYDSDSLTNKTSQPILGANSSLCLSCHDGTVAPGLSIPYGQFDVTGKMTDLLGTKLETSHPFSFQKQIEDVSHLVASLAGSGTTADLTGAVKLIKGNVECTSCHNPHNQYVDKLNTSFLVIDNKKSALCLACHETQPRTVKSKDNPLAGWTTSAHAISDAQLSATAFPGTTYTTVAELGCSSCHASHGAGAGTPLLRNPEPPIANMDTTTQSCIACHNGGDKLLKPILDVYKEFNKKGHPFATSSNQHSSSEPTVLMQNRHATCADCHNSHVAGKVTNFGFPPDLRDSQRGVSGVAMDGTVLTVPATKQYENCLRCHGDSTGKGPMPAWYYPARASFGGDAFNEIPQFGNNAISYHPVMRDATGVNQVSLRGTMLQLDGTTPSHWMSNRIFCTDCHNSNDNREFGGLAPNGPHGSDNDHILERRYEQSKVNPGTWPTEGPGTLITNLNPDPPLGAATGGPYSLCAKCHDLSIVVSDVPPTYVKHSKHINKGISCSACHSAHGVPASSPVPLTGKRLINFDMNLVRANTLPSIGGPVSYNGSTCVLTCHMMNHNTDGTVTAVIPGQQ